MASAPLRDREPVPRTVAAARHRPVERGATGAMRIVVKTANGVALLPLSEVDCLEADGNSVIVHTATGERHRIRESLSHMLEQLSGHGFIRIHRGAVVAAAAIRTIEKGRYRKAFCLLRNGLRQEIGRVEFQRLRALWQVGVLDLRALSAGLTLLPPG